MADDSPPRDPPRPPPGHLRCLWPPRTPSPPFPSSTPPALLSSTPSPLTLQTCPPAPCCCCSSPWMPLLPSLLSPLLCILALTSSPSWCSPHQPVLQQQRNILVVATLLPCCALEQMTRGGADRVRAPDVLISLGRLYIFVIFVAKLQVRSACAATRHSRHSSATHARA